MRQVHGLILWAPPKPPQAGWELYSAIYQLRKWEILEKFRDFRDAPKVLGQEQVEWDRTSSQEF